MDTLRLRISAGSKKRSLGSSIYKSATSRLIILVLKKAQHNRGGKKMKIWLSYSRTRLLLNLLCTRIFVQEKWKHAHLFKRDKEYILVCKPRDKAAMLVVSTIEFFLKESARKRSLIPKEEKRFCSQTNNMVDCVYFVKSF